MLDSFLISIWLLCTSLGGEILFLMHICKRRVIPYRRCIYQGGEDIVLIRKLCFIFFLVGFMVLSVMLCFSHHIMFCVLDMLTSLCYCASLNAYSDDQLLCYVIFVVISLWLFWCMIKLLTYFTSCLLDHNLLVTLYLSFYYLLYLKGLMCFVQVFQVTSIYVSSASQEENCAHWKGKCLLLYPCLFSFCVLYPCCFCKLLGLFSCICRLLWFVPMPCCIVLVVFSCIISSTLTHVS